MYLSQKSIDDFLSFKSKPEKEDIDIPYIKTRNRNRYYNKETNISQEFQKTDDRLEQNPNFHQLKTQLKIQVAVTVHKSYLALVNRETSGPVLLNSIFETLNNTNITDLGIFKNVIKLKQCMFKSQDNYEHISVTSSHYIIFCEYLDICSSISINKQPGIERKMKKNPIQFRTKFETKVDVNTVTFLKVIGTLNGSDDVVWTVLIRSRNKVYCLPIENATIEKEDCKLNDADKVLISVKFQELQDSIVCIIFSVKPLVSEKVSHQKLSYLVFSSIENSTTKICSGSVDRFVVHKLITKLNSEENSFMTLQQLCLFLNKFSELKIEDKDLFDILDKYGDIFIIDAENTVSLREFDQQYAEEYIRMGPVVLQKHDDMHDLQASNTMIFMSKKGTVSISNIQGKFIKTDSSAHVLFKLCEKSGNVYSLKCKPTAFGCTLPFTTKNVIFKIYAYASNKKVDVIFSIGDEKVKNYMGQHKEETPKGVDNVNKNEKISKDIIICATILTFLLHSKKKGKDSKSMDLDWLHSYQKKNFRILVSKNKYEYVLENSNNFERLKSKNHIKLRPTWMEKLISFASNVEHFQEDLDMSVPISYNPSWVIKGSKKTIHIIVKDIRANIICFTNKKKAFIKLGEYSDTIGIDCTDTDVDIGPNQSITISINGTNVRKNEKVLISVTISKTEERQNTNSSKVRCQKKKHKRKTFLCDEEFFEECLDELKHPLLSSENPCILTITDSEDENIVTLTDSENEQNEVSIAKMI